MVAKLLRVCYHVLRPSRLCIRIRMPTATSHATRLLPLQRPSRSVARMCRPDRRPHGGSSRSHGRLHASSRWRAVHIRCVMLLACYFEAAKSGLVRQRRCPAALLWTASIRWRGCLHVWRNMCAGATFPRRSSSLTSGACSTHLLPWGDASSRCMVSAVSACWCTTATLANCVYCAAESCPVVLVVEPKPKEQNWSPRHHPHCSLHQVREYQ